MNSKAALPLAGIRVVDLSRVFAMPYAGAYLADLGAEVIKVDTHHTQFMDTTRIINGPYPDNEPGELYWERGGTFQTLNRSKRSLTLDLRSEAALAILKRLVQVSDIVLENFTPRVMERFGLSYRNLRALKPDLIVFDEPVSALDVSIQAQVLNLMRDLQEELGLTYLFITHNLAVVDYVSDNIAVMCQGRLVEMAPRKSLFKSPIHPYTRALMAAVPFADLHHPLDFEALMDGRMSDPAAWPGPFTVGPSTSQDFIEVDNEHFVLASSGFSGEQVLRSVS